MRFARRRAAPRLLVVGPDGSGKSTVARGVAARLTSRGLRVNHLHFLPFGPAKQNPDQMVTAPHALPARGASQFAALAFRWWKYLRSSLTSGGLSTKNVDAVIQERGWLDQLVDGRRYRLSKAGVRCASLLAPFTPQMDGVVVCTGDPAVMAARKKELSSSETARQIEAIQQATGDLPRVVLDTTVMSVAEVVAAAESFVLGARQQTLANALGVVVPMPKRLEMLGSPASGPGRRALYRPLSRTGAVARALAVRMPLLPDPQRARLIGEVLTCLDVPLDSVAAIRSSDRQRAVISVVRSAEVVEFLKISWAKDEGLVAESRMLTEAGSSAGLRVPEVLALETGPNWTALRISAIGGAPWERSAWLQRAVDVAVALRFARGGEGVTHGDLAPWNVLDGDPPGLIDWEMASSEFFPGADLMNFIEVSGSLKRCPRERIVAALHDYRERAGLTDWPGPDEIYERMSAEPSTKPARQGIP